MKKLWNIVLALLKFFIWFLLGLWALYLFGAFYYDMQLGMPAGISVIIFLTGLVTILFVLKRRYRILTFITVCSIVTVAWSTIKPSNDRNWEPDKAILSYAEFDGDLVNIHDMRDAYYPEARKYELEYVDRTYDLSKIVGMDLYNCYWTSDLIAHPMLSWRFEDGKAFTISIENRNTTKKGYSVLGGFFKQYELIYIVSTDRDAVHRRTIYDPEDRIYMYMLDVTPREAREALVDYLNRVNELYDKPAWYNTLLNNCTTTIQVHLVATQDFPMPWNWGILFPGLYCKSIYDHGGMVSDLPYEELAERGLRNKAANRIGRADDFWKQIRMDVPGFESYNINKADSSISFLNNSTKH